MAPNNNFSPLKKQHKYYMNYGKRFLSKCLNLVIFYRFKTRIKIVFIELLQILLEIYEQLIIYLIIFRINTYELIVSIFEGS